MTIRFERANGDHCLVVSDNGIGMSASVDEKDAVPDDRVGPPPCQILCCPAWRAVGDRYRRARDDRSGLFPRPSLVNTKTPLRLAHETHQPVQGWARLERSGWRLRSSPGCNEGTP